MIENGTVLGWQGMKDEGWGVGRRLGLVESVCRSIHQCKHGCAVNKI